MVTYLPGGVSMSEVAEVICNPFVDGREGDFAFLAGFHGHADECGIGIRWLYVRVGLIVDVFHGLGLHAHSKMSSSGRRRRNGLARGMGHTHASWVSSQG